MRSIWVFLIPNKASLVPEFLKGSRHSYVQTLCQWGHTLLSVHSHMLYLLIFFFQQKVASWLCVPGNNLKSISRGFQVVSHTPLHPRSHPYMLKSLVGSPSNAEVQGWETWFHSSECTAPLWSGVGSQYTVSCCPQLPVTPAPGDCMLLLCASICTHAHVSVHTHLK